MAAGRPQPAQQRLVVLPATLDETPGRVHAGAPTSSAPALPAAHDHTLYATLSAVRAFEARLPPPTTTTQPAPVQHAQRDPWRPAPPGCAYEALIRSIWQTDQDWAVSIAWRESRCQPDAYNPSGASGLFQIEPNSWHDPGGCPWSARFDARCNIEAAWELHQMRGRQPWAL